MKVNSLQTNVLFFTATSLLVFIKQCVVTHDAEITTDICKEASAIDDNICNILQYPRKDQKFKINKYIKSYINEIEKLVVILMKHKMNVSDNVKHFIGERSARFMNLTLKIDNIDNSFQWNEKQLKEFKELREHTRDVWMKVNILQDESSV
ncbi:hypothetical protein J6590_026074 [Homalodisca vitripennis]|nr:hypothetical protein J6590_026074 [Homalodisca vitripennis]